MRKVRFNFIYKLSFCNFVAKLNRVENPKPSVPPWLFTTGPVKPKKIAPLYFLGSRRSLNLFSEK